MRRLTLLLPLALAACGPPGSELARFRVLEPGSGEPVVTRINRNVGTRQTLLAEDASRGDDAALEGVISRRQVLASGAEVAVYSTPGAELLIQTTPDGELSWGTAEETDDSPILTVKLPLRLGLRWDTADARGVPFYEFHVTALEAVVVPAGRFDTARVQQVNLRTGEVSERWYAEDVGQVQRANPAAVLLRYALVTEATP